MVPGVGIPLHALCCGASWLSALEKLVWQNARECIVNTAHRGCLPHKKPLSTVQSAVKEGFERRCSHEVASASPLPPSARGRLPHTA